MDSVFHILYTVMNVIVAFVSMFCESAEPVLCTCATHYESQILYSLTFWMTPINCLQQVGSVRIM